MNLGNLFKFIVDWTNVTSDGQQNLLVEIPDIIGNNCNIKRSRLYEKL